MHRRQWDAKIKARLVVEGLQGQPVAELCHEHQISHSPYDQWRDQFLAHAAHAFAAHQHTRTAARLAPENARRKTLVGALTRELKNSDERWG
jgi:transposase-like protein